MRSEEVRGLPAGGYPLVGGVGTSVEGRDWLGVGFGTLGLVGVGGLGGLGGRGGRVRDGVSGVSGVLPELWCPAPDLVASRPPSCLPARPRSRAFSRAEAPSSRPREPPALESSPPCARSPCRCTLDPSPPSGTSAPAPAPEEDSPPCRARPSPSASPCTVMHPWSAASIRAPATVRATTRTADDRTPTPVRTAGVEGNRLRQGNRRGNGRTVGPPGAVRRRTGEPPAQLPLRTTGHAGSPSHDEAQLGTSARPEASQVGCGHAESESRSRRPSRSGRRRVRAPGRPDHRPAPGLTRIRARAAARRRCRSGARSHGRRSPRPRRRPPHARRPRRPPCAASDPGRP